LLTAVTRVVVAVAVGLSLASITAVSTMPAFAQEQLQPPSFAPPVPSEVERPDVLLAAKAVCFNGTAGIDVQVYDSRPQPHNIAVFGQNSIDQKETALGADGDHHVTFPNLSPGQYTVRPMEGGQASDGVDVVIKDCKEAEPASGLLTVGVECKAGWGLVTFVVTSPASSETREYTLTVPRVGSEHPISVGDGMFLRITENGYDDGDYLVTLIGADGKELVSKEFTVACATKNAPKLVVAANCDAKDDITTPAAAFVSIDNPNRAPVDYTIKVAGSERQLYVEGGSNGFVELDPLGEGEYVVTVTGSDETVTRTDLDVDRCAGVRRAEDGLQAEVRCDGDKSVVTFRFFDVTGAYPAKHKFSVDGDDSYDETVEFAGEGPYQWSRYPGAFADGEYTARLIGSGLATVKRFAVRCPSGPEDRVQPVESSAPSVTQPAPTTTVAPIPQASPGPQADLPVTGADVGGLVAVGAAALGLGVLLMIFVRRKRGQK
jgi:LPXTG-motif cell wall-anchored protein